MSVGRLHNIFIATHHFEESLAFWRALGWEVTRNIRDGAAMLDKADAPSLLIDRVGAEREAETGIFFDIPDRQFEPVEGLDVVHGFEATHWGSEVMQLRDPDGRLFNLERQR